MSVAKNGSHWKPVEHSPKLAALGVVGCGRLFTEKGCSGVELAGDLYPRRRARFLESTDLVWQQQRQRQESRSR